MNVVFSIKEDAGRVHSYVHKIKAKIKSYFDHQ